MLSKIHLGQTEHGSFVTTLLTPILPPQVPSLYPDDQENNLPPEHCLTVRLMESLTALHRAIELAVLGKSEALLKSFTLE